METFKTPIIITILLLSFNLKGQFSTKDYSFGGSTESTGNKIFKLSNNKYVSFSTINSLNNYTFSFYGKSDCLAIIHDKNKSILNSKTFGGIDSEKIIDIHKDIDNNFYVIMTSYSGISGTKKIPLISTYDTYIIKIDSNLNQIWEKAISFSGIKENKSLILNNKLFIIRSKNLISIDLLTGNILSTDNLNIKLSPDLTPYFNIENLYYKNNYFYLSGSCSIGSTSSPYLQDFIIKMNFSTLNIAWVKKINIYQNTTQQLLNINTNNHIEILQNNEIIFFKLVDVTNPLNRVAPIKSSSTDIWCVKLDVFGNSISEHSFGNGGLIKNYLVENVNDTNLFIVSTVNNSPISYDQTNTPYGKDDLWLINVNENLIIKDNLILGGTENDLVTNLNTQDNKLFISAKSNSPISGNKTDSTHSFSQKFDSWFILFSICDYTPPTLFNIPLDPDYNTGIYIPSRCQTDTFTISIDSPDPNKEYYWYNNSVLININEKINIPPTSSPINTYSIQNFSVKSKDTISGCISIIRDIKLSNGKSKPKPLLLQPTLIPEICKGDSIYLASNASLNNYKWTHNNNIISNLTGTFTPKLYLDTNYIYLSKYDSITYPSNPLNWSLPDTFNMYCESHRTEIKILTKKVDIPSFFNLPTLSCIKDSVSLQPLPNPNLTSYKWYNENNYIDSIYWGEPYLYPVKNTDTIYVAGFDFTNCPSYPLPIPIKSNELFPSYTTSSNSIIEGAYKFFKNTTQSKYGIKNYSWEFSDGLINQDTNTYHYFYQIGNNTVTLTAYDSVGCKLSYTNPLGINVTPCNCNKRDLSGISIYPTFFTNHFSIDFELESNYRLMLFNITGKLIFDETTNKKFNFIDNITAPKGIYVLKIFGENGFSSSSKLIKR